MNEQEAHILLKKYRSGQCSPAEKRLVEHWFLHFQIKDMEELDDQRWQEVQEAMWEQINAAPQPEKTRRLKKWSIAASILLPLLFVAYYFFSAHISLHQKKLTDIEPGGNKATLTLADGRKILLDEARAGDLAKQGNFVIAKTGDGELTYHLRQGAGSQENQLEPAINTIETPKGGQFQVVLPDGTKVWLNAQTILKYPVDIKASHRQIEIQGEAYFEVSPSAHDPFTIHTFSQEVQVLGTRLNIRAYQQDHNIRTTLVDGKISVSHSSSKQTKILKPNQQSILSNQDQALRVREVDPEDIIAWKEGFFVFNNTPLGRIAQDLERWYDVQVSFEEESLQELRFSGAVSRYEKASQVLDKLEMMGDVRFTFEDHHIHVLQPKNNR